MQGRWLGLVAVVGLALTGLLALAPAPVSAEPTGEVAVGSVTQFDVGAAGAKQATVQGPNGLLYYATLESPPRIGVFDPASPGTAPTVYGDAALTGVRDMTIGGDGNLWITDGATSGNVVRFNLTTHAFTAFPASSVFPGYIAKAADGSLWYTAGGGATRQMSTGGTVSGLSCCTGSNGDIILGPDGYLWQSRYAGNGDNSLTRIDPGTAAIVEHSTTLYSTVGRMTVGPDDNLWVAGGNGIVRYRIGTDQFTQFTNPNHVGYGEIVVGGDGNLWFTSPDSHRIGRITPSGVITMFPAFPSNTTLAGLTATTDGNAWLTIRTGATAKLARINIGTGPTCNGQIVTVRLAQGEHPTAGNDVILGTAAANTVNGLGGNDVICGLGGADKLTGAAGNDTLVGGDGADTLDGGAGNDRLVGGAQRDTCKGGPGQDTQQTCEVKTGIP